MTWLQNIQAAFQPKQLASGLQKMAGKALEKLKPMTAKIAKGIAAMGKKVAEVAERTVAPVGKFLQQAAQKAVGATSGIISQLREAGLSARKSLAVAMRQPDPPSPLEEESGATISGQRLFTIQIHIGS